ncbi:hypothetical protein ACPEIC_03355 [Stenotrophomonas sp. NPDC087984]
MNRKIRRTGGVHSTVIAAAATSVTVISPRGRCNQSGPHMRRRGTQAKKHAISHPEHRHGGDPHLSAVEEPEERGRCPAVVAQRLPRVPHRHQHDRQVLGVVEERLPLLVRLRLRLRHRAVGAAVASGAYHLA